MRKLFVIALFAILWHQGSTYECYFCSWSPKDENNRTDVCSEVNFAPKNVYRDECPSGCEIYVQWDLNGELEHVRRNCGENITGRCMEETTKTHRRKRCTCSGNLCNSANRANGRTALHFAPIVFTLAAVRLSFAFC